VRVSDAARAVASPAARHSAILKTGDVNNVVQNDGMVDNVFCDDRPGLRSELHGRSKSFQGFNGR
jgi:hypothetical protein